MAGELGRTTADLEKDLLQNGGAYDFFQAVRLIGLLGRQGARNGESADQKLRIRPELSFNCPSADISGISRLQDEPGFDITTTFMGLYGVCSPLPAFFTEELLDDEWDEVTAPRGFLDIIHQHLYPLLYQTWIKYKFSHNAVENGNGDYWNILYSLIGLGTDEIKAAVGQPENLLRYIGLIGRQQKSASGLQTILKDYLQPLEVEIVPCVARNVKIPEAQRFRLGEEQCNLGDTAVLGQQIMDRTGKVVVRIGPLDSRQYADLMGDAEKRSFVRFIVKLYMMQPLDFDIVLSLAPGAIEGILLGQNRWSSLGTDTWLYSRGNTETVDMLMS